MEILDYIPWQSGFDEDVMDLLNDGRRLRRRLKNDSVPGKQCWYQGVDKDQIRILLDG